MPHSSLSFTLVACNDTIAPLPQDGASAALEFSIGGYGGGGSRVTLVNDTVVMWHGRYNANGIVDGLGWDLRLTASGRQIVSSGSNAYPDRERLASLHMQQKPTAVPDSSAVRVALWRALHVEVDASPHVINDTVGLELVAPDENWRSRPDMDPDGTRGFRAGIVARARFVDDLVTEQAALGVTQYLILGAGLDTFAQRRPEIASRIRIFEIDQPETQAWKRQRLIDLGFGIPDWLRLVPVDFEAGDDWWDRLAAAGFDASRPTVVACTGVTMYLTRDAVAATLRRLATLATGSTLAMTFLLPAELTEGKERQQHKEVQKNARASGTPFLSFFTPPEMLAMARDAGFASVAHVPAADLAQRYFDGRTDGLRPSSGESFLIATT